jgi:hypothetical protein
MRYISTLFLCAASLAADVPPARLVITGDLPAPLTLTAADLCQMPRQDVTMLEEKNGKTVYTGVPLLEILKKANLPLGADLKGNALAICLVAGAHDGYQVAFGLAELDPAITGIQAIVADTREGQPLSAEQGPLRLVVASDKRGARSVRMLETLRGVQLRQQLPTPSNPGTLLQFPSSPLPSVHTAAAAVARHSTHSNPWRTSNPVSHISW